MIMNKDTNILREASNLFMEAACIYERMADLGDAEDTKEKQDELTMLIRKLMLTMTKVQGLEV